MTTSTLTRRALLPVVGTVTAAATAIGASAPMSQAAPTAPDAGDSTLNLGATAAVGQDTGTFESCSAYFGFGKEGGEAQGVVDFDVVDQNGDDGVDHAVGTDTGVVFVIEYENDEGPPAPTRGTIECVPAEITEAEWNQLVSNWDDEPFVEDTHVPPYPGPGHYAYPSADAENWIEDFGDVTSVSFRVVGLPDGHSLVSPEGSKPLIDLYFSYDGVDTPDPRVVDVAEAGAGADAAAAFEAAYVACSTDGDAPDLTGDDLMAAIDSLLAYVGDDEGLTDLSCTDVYVVHDVVSGLSALAASIDYTELITLALPVEPAPTPTPQPGPATAPNAVVANPTFTG